MILTTWLHDVQLILSSSNSSSWVHRHTIKPYTKQLRTYCTNVRAYLTADCTLRLRKNITSPYCSLASHHPHAKCPRREQKLSTNSIDVFKFIIPTITNSRSFATCKNFSAWVHQEQQPSHWHCSHWVSNQCIASQHPNTDGAQQVNC